MIQLLLEHNANATYCENNGKIPFQNARVTQCDGEGNTPLHIACKLDENSQVIQMLLNHSVSVTKCDINGKSPLHIACGVRNNSQVIQMLLEQNARVTQCDGERETPLHIACKLADNSEVILMLLKHCASETEIENNDIVRRCIIQHADDWIAEGYEEFLENMSNILSKPIFNHLGLESISNIFALFAPCKKRKITPE